MKLPRFLFRPLARHYFMLWRLQCRESMRLREELTEWRDKFLLSVHSKPLFQIPQKPIEPEPRPPVGPSAKKAYLAERQQASNEPTAEDILRVN